jgi:RimJ/RimL family protein N-acetyltransferase
MIKRATVDDLDYIHFVLRHPDIYPYIIDSGSPKEAKNYDVTDLINNPIVYCLIPVIDDKQIGIFFLHPHNFVMYEIHSNILPKYRGWKAFKAGKQVCEWMFQYTFCKKIISCIPDGNDAALALALKCSFQIEGRYKKAFLKDNQLRDLILVGVSKEDICQ